MLDRVTLEFATHNDDKKADTKLNVHIVNRISASVVQDIAIGVDLLPGKRFADDGPLANRRDRASWSASVTDNPLASPNIRLADIVLPVVYVIIDPPGDDKWNFDYEVTYEFVDAKNADGKRHVFSSRTNGVVLDQDHPKHEGVYQGSPFPTVVPATAPPLTVQPVGPRAKPIPLSFLQLKIDEFLGRGGPLDSDAPALLQVRLHNSGNFAHGTTPESYLDLQSLVPTGKGLLRAYVSSPAGIGQLDFGYYFQDVKSSRLNLTIDPTKVTPLTLSVEFETGGPVELPSKKALCPNVDFGTFAIAIDLTLGVDRGGVQVQGHEATLVDLLSWLTDIEHMTFKEYGGSNPVVECIGTFLGQPVHVFVSGYMDDGIVHFASQVVHIDLDTDVNSYIEDKIRFTLRSKLFKMLSTPDRLTDRTMRDAINARATSVLLGGIADDPLNTDGNNCVIDSVEFKLADPANGIPEDMLVLTYTGPQKVFVPVQPPDWPTLGNPGSTYDFAPDALAGIEHIVVLTMENRSFDHMLGYLSLPLNLPPELRGGAGRTDIDGLTGHESNTYKGTVFPSFPFITETLFSPDPPHGFEPVTRAINGGGMDGFVRSFAEEHGDRGADRIMGHCIAATVPQFDALVRDFAVLDRWFASHPGPSFPNRFYELTGRLNINSKGFWEFDDARPIRPVFTPTIFDYLNGGDPITGRKLTWRYFERGYCFLRFFEKYTFDTEHIADIEDAKVGFFELASTGQLPHVSFIDPHYVELPPGGNSDGPPADVALGQELIQRVVEAVIGGPAWEKTLLLIVYDEHGGFYDHVPPPAAVKVSEDIAIETLGVRVPAIVVSPWVGAGQVFGHTSDPNDSPLVFDHTSILRTIARRFISNAPPYLGARYATAADLSAIVKSEPRRPRFRPYIRYRLTFLASQQMLAVANHNPSLGTPLCQAPADGSPAQDFSFEDAGDGFFYIRTQITNFYLSVAEPASASSAPALRQDAKYPPTAADTGLRPALQRFKLISVGISQFTRDHYVISSEAYPDLEMQVTDPGANDSPVVLGPPSPHGQAGPPTAWLINSPAIR